MDFTSTPDSRIWDLSPMRLGGAKSKMNTQRSMHLYGVRPHKDHRGVNLIFDALPFGRLWYGEPNAISSAIGYAKHRSRSHDTVIRVYDEAGPFL